MCQTTNPNQQQRAHQHKGIRDQMVRLRSGSVAESAAAPAPATMSRRSSSVSSESAPAKPRLSKSLSHASQPSSQSSSQSSSQPPTTRRSARAGAQPSSRASEADVSAPTQEPAAAAAAPPPVTRRVTRSNSQASVSSDVKSHAPKSSAASKRRSDSQSSQTSAASGSKRTRAAAVRLPAIPEDALPKRELTSFVCRFVDWVPEGVEAMAACSSEPWLALGRSNGDVELWEMRGRANHQWLVVPGDRSWHLRSLAFCGSRLFGAGLDGRVWETDMKRQAHTFSESYGGAVWCMRAHPTDELLAAACDDGRVRLLVPRALEPGLEYDRTLMGGSGARLLAVCWHTADPDLVFASGMDGLIRRWSVRQNRVTLSITVPSLGKSLPPCLWTLDACGESLASGDAQGRVALWDVESGVQLAQFNEHQADVLAVKFSADGRALFASGVDPRVAAFRLAPDGRWVYSYSHRPHTHDVRALAMVQGCVLSGGVDAQLCSVVVDQYETSRPRKESPFRQRGGAVGVSRALADAQQQRLVLVAHNAHLELWHVELATQQRTHVCTVGFGEQPLFCAALSPDGALLASCDAGTGLATFAVAYDVNGEEELGVRKVRVCRQAGRLAGRQAGWLAG
jgi:WD40 repeat protein